MFRRFSTPGGEEPEQPKGKRLAKIIFIENALTFAAPVTQQKTEPPNYSEEDIAKATHFLKRRASQTSNNGRLCIFRRYFLTFSDNLGGIQPELYRRHNAPVEQKSLSGNILARVHAELFYDYSRSDLVLTLLNGNKKPKSKRQE